MWTVLYAWGFFEKIDFIVIEKLGLWELRLYKKFGFSLQGANTLLHSFTH